MPTPRWLAPALALALAGAPGGVHAGTIHVPDDVPSIEAAVAAATAGDTVLIGEGLWGMPDTLRVPSGLTLRSAVDRDLTEVEIGYYHMVLEDGPDTTRIEDLTFVCAYWNGATVNIASHNPHTLIRGNRFVDIIGAGDTGQTLNLYAGGVVEHNSFGTTAYWSVTVWGGDSTLVRYNTWAAGCDMAGTVMVAVRGAPRKVELRKNTMLDGGLYLVPQSPATSVLLVNNLMDAAFSCGLFNPVDIELRYNYLVFPDFHYCEPYVTMGPGNIIIEELPAPSVFCPSNPYCAFWVRGDSPVANAGENSETIGAWGIGCDPVPIEPVPEPTDVLPYAVVGRARPNPSGGGVTLYVGIRTARIDVFDAAGRHVCALDTPAEPGPVSWTGRGEDGDPVPSGQYFVRVEAENGAHAVRRVHIVR